MEPKAIVIGGYGFNADAELAEAFRLAGARIERLHVADLVADPGRLSGARILAFPGGFSFGDHLGSGQVLALLCRRTLRPALERFVADGRPRPSACATASRPSCGWASCPTATARWGREASLIQNESGRFVDGWYPVAFEAGSRCLWTKGLAERLLPVRHGEGRFVARDEAALDALEGEGLVAARYSESEPQRLRAGDRGHLRPERPRVRPHAPSRGLPISGESPEQEAADRATSRASSFSRTACAPLATPPDTLAFG